MIHGLQIFSGLGSMLFWSPRTGYLPVLQCCLHLKLNLTDIMVKLERKWVLYLHKLRTSLITIAGLGSQQELLPLLCSGIKQLLRHYKTASPLIKRELLHSQKRIRAACKEASEIIPVWISPTIWDLLLQALFGWRSKAGRKGAKVWDCVSGYTSDSEQLHLALAVWKIEVGKPLHVDM